MNKGLEVIEASILFIAEPKKIEVLVHPQSIVHSLVEYQDGSVLAQMSSPDMRIPIAHALAYPQRINSGCHALDLTQLKGLEFFAPDYERFPCLGLAYKALELGGIAPAILNAVNEVAVYAFLDNRLDFFGIPRLIERVLSQYNIEEPHSIEHLIAVDTEARILAKEYL